MLRNVGKDEARASGSMNRIDKFKLNRTGRNLTRLSLGFLNILLGIRLALAKLLLLSCVQLGAVTSSIAVKVSQNHNP